MGVSTRLWLNGFSLLLLTTGMLVVSRLRQNVKTEVRAVRLSTRGHQKFIFIKIMTEPQTETTSVEIYEMPSPTAQSPSQTHTNLTHSVPRPFPPRLSSPNLPEYPDNDAPPSMPTRRLATLQQCQQHHHPMRRSWLMARADSATTSATSDYSNGSNLIPERPRLWELSSAVIFIHDSDSNSEGINNIDQ